MSFIILKKNSITFGRVSIEFDNIATIVLKHDDSTKGKSIVIDFNTKDGKEYNSPFKITKEFTERFSVWIKKFMDDTDIQTYLLEGSSKPILMYSTEEKETIHEGDEILDSLYLILVGFYH